MSKHHPSQNQLIGFASGALPIHYATAISSHLSFCTRCKADAKKLESLGGASLENVQKSEINADLKSKVLNMLDNDIPPKSSPFTENRTIVNSLPGALRKLVPEGLDNLDWRWTGPGIHSFKLDSIPNGSQLSLLRIQPGKPIAHHTHKGNEITLLLEGSLSDEYGVYQKGDYILMDEQHKHRPVASNDEACICLTVVDHPLHFTGFLMGMLNPIIAHYLK